MCIRDRYQRIRARAEAGEKSILLVPEQFTSSTEGRIHREIDVYKRQGWA